MQLSISTPKSFNRSKFDDTKLLSIFSILLLFTAFLHHAFFCLINTHIFSISSSSLVLTELSFLGMAFLFFIRNTELSYLILLVFVVSNAFVLAIFQQGFDPKHIRNFIIPILMIWLGSRYDKSLNVDSLVRYMAWIFLFFGLFEMFMPETFQKVFNVLKFQIATGRTVEGEGLDYLETTFSLNGTRWGGRNILPFLGDHRVSSVFLETVNASNFCTLLAAWGLSKNRLKDGWQFYTIAIIMSVLADSRFGVTLIMLMTSLRFFCSPKILNFTSYFLPLMILIVCFYLGWNYTVFRDDFVTRLGSTGHYILNFSLKEFFGISSVHYRTFADQGYARLIHFNGIILVTIVWFAFCRLRIQSTALYFKSFVGLIMSSNLAISGDSVFAFKWAAIMWFLIGTTIQNKPESQLTRTH